LPGLDPTDHLTARSPLTIQRPISDWSPPVESILLAQADPTSYQVLEQTFGGRMLEGFLLMTVGMLIVFTVLLVLGELIRVLSIVLKRLEATERVVEPAKSMEAAPASGVAPVGGPGGGGLDGRTLAIIAAAATAAIGGPVRVRRVTRVLQPGRGSAWIGAGRQELQTSHQVRK
jgi:Na+-transporting methylmalonyl-CoA/oxaloacetate decarboxylase gamma subunit